MGKEETQKARDRQAKAKAFYAEQGKANPGSDLAYSKLSPEQKEARHDIFKSIPFIGQAAKAADAGAEGLRQVGKYGKDIDPRLAALENLGGKSAMSPDEMSSAWDSKVGGALSAIKKIPGMSMRASTLNREITGIDENNKEKKMTVSQALDNVLLGKGGDPRMTDRYNQKSNLRANIASGMAFPVAARSAPISEGRYLDPLERGLATELLKKAGRSSAVTFGGRTVPSEQVAENLKRAISDDQGLNILRSLGYK